MAALTRSGTFTDCMRMYRRHDDGVDTLFGYVDCTVVLYPFELPDMVLQECFAVFPDNGECHLTTRNSRGNTPLTVLAECRIFPSQVGARFGHLTVYKKLFQVVHFSGFTVVVGFGSGEIVRVLFPFRVIYLDMTAVALRCPGSMTGIALKTIHMRLDLTHRDHTFSGNIAFLFQSFKRCEGDIFSVCQMHNDFVPLFNRFGKRIAACHKDVSVPLIFGNKSLFKILFECFCRSSRFTRFGFGGKFVTVSQRQFPWVFVHRTVAVLTLDLDCPEIGASEKSVTMQIVGGVTILTEHPFGVVDIFCQVQVAFCV